MRLAAFRPLRLEDYPDAPEGLGAVFEALNQTLEQVITALSRNLTFEDNFACEVKELSLRDNTPMDVKVSVRGKPRGLVLLDYEIPSDDTPQYHLEALQIVDRETVRVKVSFPETAPAGEVRVRLLVLGA